MSRDRLASSLLRCSALRSTSGARRYAQSPAFYCLITNPFVFISCLMFYHGWAFVLGRTWGMRVWQTCFKHRYFDSLCLLQFKSWFDNRCMKMYYIMKYVVHCPIDLSVQPFLRLILLICSDRKPNLKIFRLENTITNMLLSVRL